MAERRIIRLRFPGRCAGCSSALAKGTRAAWDPAERTLTCLACVEAVPAADAPSDGDAPRASPDLFDLAPEAVIGAAEPAQDSPRQEPEIDRGKAGASAAREWQRRHERREQEIRARWGKLGGLVLTFSDDPHSTAAWAYGANGESALGAQLDRLREEDFAVLHDRRIPGSRANIDHLVVGPWGVFVIDAKNYKGRVERRDRGGFFTTDYRLYVGGRDKTSLIDGLARQVEAVRAALGGDFAAVSLCKVLCFVDADWSLFARPIEMSGAHILWPRALGKLVRGEGELGREAIAQIERKLALALPPA